MLLAALFLAALPAVVQDAAPAPAAHRTPGWDDFPVFVWREAYAGKPLPEELAAPFGGVILMREEDSSWARERGLAYLVWNVAGRDALHLDADAAWEKRVEDWIRTQDPKLLVREPCLNDPQTVAQLFGTLDATIARHGAHPGLGFVLGDEVSLTPNGDPFDLCRCGFCEANWRKYAEENQLPVPAPLTDHVRLALLADDFSLLGPWMHRRRFDARQLPEVLTQLAARSGMHSNWTLPGPYACLLGCKYPTAFGGLALEAELLASLGTIECYPIGGAREQASTVPGLSRHGLHFSTGPNLGPERAITTLFLGVESTAGLAWGVYDAWLRGDSGLVLWSDSSLAALPGEARTRLDEAVGVVRSMRWKLPDNDRSTPVRFPPRPSTVALVRDADSTAVSFLRDALLDGPTWPRRKASYQQEHGRLERKVETWLRLLEDCNLQPGVLPLASVCVDCTPEFDVLVLPEVLVLGDDDLERLAGYVAKGGMLVVDGTLGWVDRDGHLRRDEDLRKRLAGDHPERVRTAPELMEGYLESRFDPARAASARAFVRDLPPLQRQRRLLREGGHLVLPDFVGDAASMPWRVRVSGPLEDGARLFLLPNLPTLADRARLRDVSLEGILAPEGFELEWLRPAQGMVLRAGDAALARVRRAR